MSKEVSASLRRNDTIEQRTVEYRVPRFLGRQKCANPIDSSKNVTAAVVRGLEVVPMWASGRFGGSDLTCRRRPKFRNETRTSPTTWGVVGLWWGLTGAAPQFVGL